MLAMPHFISQKPLILASGSQARQNLLHALGLHFTVCPSDCDEESYKQQHDKSQPWSILANTLAQAKALLVSQRFPDVFVIGADQLCVFGDICLDKPGDHETAVEHLRLLQGNTHQQLSACAIAHNGHILWHYVDTASLSLRPLSNVSIDAYLRIETPYQSCGAYHYEGQAKWLFSAIEGSESTIQGLPITPLVNAMLQLEIVSL